MTMYVIHLEFHDVTSAAARKAANAAWYAAEASFGESAIGGQAERRADDGSEPEWAGWRDWADESDTSCRRLGG